MTRTTRASTSPGKPMLSEQVYAHLRDAIMHGNYAPGDALKPQDLAKEHGVSLAVVREALVRVVGEGLADRLPNRGFVVPAFSDRRWQEIAEARRTIEPVLLRMSIKRGDLDWEARLRAAHHRLARTPAFTPAEGEYFSDAWSEAHRVFHRALLEGCGNPVLLETFDRRWTASELARRWSAQRTPDRDYVGEHRRLEEAALARDAGAAAETLAQHLTLTAAVLTGCTHHGPVTEACEIGDWLSPFQRTKKRCVPLVGGAPPRGPTSVLDPHFAQFRPGVLVDPGVNDVRRLRQILRQLGLRLLEVIRVDVRPGRVVREGLDQDVFVRVRQAARPIEPATAGLGSRRLGELARDRGPVVRVLRLDLPLSCDEDHLLILSC
jgi:DNA-binding GntR family transcriptional regulator